MNKPVRMIMMLRLVDPELIGPAFKVKLPFSIRLGGNKTGMPYNKGVRSYSVMEGGIRSNSVSDGFHRSEMTLLPQPGTTVMDKRSFSALTAGMSRNVHRSTAGHVSMSHLLYLSA